MNTVVAGLVPAFTIGQPQGLPLPNLQFYQHSHLVLVEPHDPSRDRKAHIVDDDLPARERADDRLMEIQHLEFPFIPGEDDVLGDAVEDDMRMI